MIFKRIIGENYLHRWHLLPRNPLFNIFLHKFLGSDDDRAMHDHPWCSVSFLLKGRLIELMPYDSEDLREAFPGAEVLRGRRIPWLWPVFRKATHTHRLVLPGAPAWTLFITGPVIRPWYFHCPKGLVHHSDFTDASGNGIGRGCE
jgi:hypothetical protein